MLYIKAYLNTITESIDVNKNDSVDFTNIPIEANLSENPNICKNIPQNFAYFGDCKNTVDVDHMWNATEMSGVLLQSDILFPTEEVINRISNGDRKIPRKLIYWIDKHKEQFNDLSKIVCGINHYQRIGFIYITEFDTHFFFDVF